jgi:hypothetical protein
MEVSIISRAIINHELTILTKLDTTFGHLLVLVVGDIVLLHRTVKDLGGLAVGNTLGFLALVKDAEKNDLKRHDGEQGDEETENDLEPGLVRWLVFGLEKKWAGNVTNGGVSTI